jgi:hypothetical protein
VPHYRFYRLRADSSIQDALDITAVDDGEAAKKAVAVGHGKVVEIWCGTRLVNQIQPIKCEWRPLRSPQP